MEALILYPEEYTSNEYIQPMRMGKTDFARLNNCSWKKVKLDIYTQEKLRTRMETFGYFTNVRAKFLSLACVKILFMYYTPPLATPENLQLSAAITYRAA